MTAVVYLLHFQTPLGNLTNPRAKAQHYLGYALDLDARIAEHRAGRGAALTRAAVQRGIDWQVFVLGWGDWRLERALKKLKAAPRLCPVCGVRHPRGRLHLPALAEQLELDLDFDPFDVPGPALRPDWWEWNYFRSTAPVPVVQLAGPLIDGCGIVF